MDIKLQTIPAISYAGAQNYIVIIQEIHIHNSTENVISNLELHLSANPEFAKPLVIHIAQIDAGATHSIYDYEWNLKHDYLVQLEEAVRGNISIELYHQEKIIASNTTPIEVLAYDQWAGFRQLPELITAFSQPNSPAISELLRAASNKLLQQYQQSLSGYQVKDRHLVARQIASIYAAIADQHIHYSNPPASFTSNGQKIRLPERIQQEKLATCLDLTLLMVSCLEQAGLNPLIFLEEGHAWVGCWLFDQSLASSSLDSREAIRKRIDAGELLAIECNGLTISSAMSFAQATKLGAERLSESHNPRFDLAIDVSRVRHGLKILPLALKQAIPQVIEVISETSLETEIIDIDLPPLGPDVLVNTTDSNTEGRSRIEIWRAKLLDLTLRNKLINFKPTKQSIPLYHPDPALIEDILAAGKSLKLKSLPDALPPQDPRSAQQQALHSQAQVKEHYSREALSRHELLADVVGQELDARLTEIFRGARIAQEEGGANTLFLVFGMLQWVDSKDASRKLQAPLVMMPVTLERQSVNSPFSVKAHDDDTRVNPTLLQLLEHQFDLKIPHISGMTELPTDGSGVDIGKIWAAFRSSVVNLTGFEVLPQVWLGMFSFTKYLMWKDLTDRLDDILKSPLVKHLVNGDEKSALVMGNFTKEEYLDEVKKPHELFIPTDCDSSQLAAVNAAADGLSFVLEGPPGTGKSQTITNIISDALARGKTVLFVSEKIAALTVVHERLKKLGLEPFLLELHSAKATKTEVLAQFDKALKVTRRHTASDWQQEANKLARMRQGLNDYVKALHQRHPNGWTVYDATTLLVRYAGRKACGFNWPSHQQHNTEQFNELTEVVCQIETVGVLVSDHDKQNLSLILRRDWSPNWQTHFVEAGQAFVDSVNQLMECEISLQKLFLLSETANSQEGLATLHELCSVMLQMKPEYTPLLAEFDFRQTESLITQITLHGKKLNELEAKILESWSADILKQSSSQLMQAWRQSQGFWWLKKWFAQFRFRSLLTAYHLQGQRPNVEQVPSLLTLLAEANVEREAFVNYADDAKRVLGHLWQGQKTDWPLLQEAMLWLLTFEKATAKVCGSDVERLLALREALAKKAKVLPRIFHVEEEIGRQLMEYQQAHDTFQTALANTMSQAGIITNALLDRRSLNALGELRRIVQAWLASSHCLRDWCNWQYVKHEAQSLGLNKLIVALENGSEAWSKASELFKFSYASWWLSQVLEKTPVLSRFVALDHERKIQEFRDTDAQFAQLTKDYIYARLAEKIPNSDIPPPNTPLGILKREIQKKTRHMPVRKLLSSTSGILSHLAPCLLMSPLSVAQYLDTADTRFDLVIFDEASQIPTWDSIGAIARGHQVIVVGDPKQLPPTNFFSASSDDEGQEGDIEDLESILDECIGSGMPTHTLKWHYRSQRESLIAFSNNRYYGSQLITFPSPVTPDNGVTYHHVEGVYQRSGARTNRQEAEAIVNFIKEHFNTSMKPIRSVGVVTFSQAQQKLIEDLLDAARRQDHNLDRLMTEQRNEPLFVKNLENVQGDERDIILFSICYGPDETGRVFMNFGPLNRDGGHRRLNVAITRAKEQVHIFATLRPDQMDISKTKSSGVADLKRYLEFAIKGAPALLAHAAPTGRLPDSPFEIEVLTYLLDKGWDVHPQVGCSSYRIDLGVVDPRAKGRYLMAVECDGASYHSAATARDRDKLRQMVLEKLGWKVHRIWSTEWWNNPEREKARLLAALDNALKVENIQHEPKVELLDKTSTSEQSILLAKAIIPSPVKKNLVLPYEQAILASGDKELFFEFSETFKIKSMMKQVIYKEGPVSESIIKKRIVAAYGFNRTGERIQQRLSSILASFKSDIMSDGRLFYWPETLNPQTWSTVRLMGGRDITEIIDQELANCAKLALEQMIVADESTLIKTMATLIGIQKVTSQSSDKLSVAVQYLRDKKMIIETVGGIKLT